MQAVNKRIVNLMRAAKMDDGPVKEIFDESSDDLIPQWAADLQIDCNAFGILDRFSDDGAPMRIKYVAPQSISVLVWRGKLEGYEIEELYRGERTHTSTPIKEQRFTGAPRQFPPEDVIHLKSGLDPRYGELMGDNALRELVAR